MAGYLYKAYISYSHQDEAWAKWLHRAIESYHVPRKLVGTTTAMGVVPARIRPVFRDRDDLSSASDLSSTVQQALAESEKLIVICSPAAAASHWVGEEIKHFAGLGRSRQIFCIIVDGEPADDGAISACFPAALTNAGIKEPLAADVRNWADGKRVARLKLIAGLLGIRLDKLRQRDLQRQRKRKVVTATAIIAAMSLTVMTIISQISERHEREKAEQLATFVVDLGERLQSDADLETLALISQEAAKHLQSLDPGKLSPQTGKKVALALRQMGRVSELQGKPHEALESYQQSRDFFARLRVKHPDIPNMLFELGNAEYYIGGLYLEQGEYEKARQALQNYHDLTRMLLASDPGNPDWLLEVSYSHNNLAALQIDSGMGIDEATLVHISEAIRLMEMVVELKPEDDAVADVYATTLAWAADAQRQVCSLDTARVLRERVTGLAKAAAESDPGNNDLKKRYAFALSGIARLQIMAGQLDLAEQNLGLAISILKQLAAADPSNVLYRQQMAYRRLVLAGLLAENGKLEMAGRAMQELAPEFIRPGNQFNEDEISRDDYIDFLLVYAGIESRLEHSESANKYLREAIELQISNVDQQSWDNFDKYRILNASYLWWEQNGESASASFFMPQIDFESAGEYKSCTASDFAARTYLMEGDRVTAASEVMHLKLKGYAEPSFLRFCKKHHLCEE